MANVCSEKDLTLIPENITFKVGTMFSNPTIYGDEPMTLEEALEENFSENQLFIQILSLCSDEVVFDDACCIGSADYIILSIPITFKYGNTTYKIAGDTPLGTYGVPFPSEDNDLRFIVINIPPDNEPSTPLPYDVFLTAYNGYLHIYIGRNRFTIEPVTDEDDNTTCRLTLLFEKFFLPLEKIKSGSNSCVCPPKSSSNSSDLCAKVKWTIGAGIPFNIPIPSTTEEEPTTTIS